MATQDEYIKTALRLPRDLHAQVQASAEMSERSMNAEIIERLRNTFRVGSFDEPGMTDMMTALTDVALNIMRSMGRDEFEYYLDRVKRANWEKMGVSPEKMPEPPPVPDLAKRRGRKA